MPEERQQIQRTRRSRRQAETQPATTTAAPAAFDDAQTRLDEIDDIISDIMTPSNGQESVSLGDDSAHDVRQVSNEELVNNFRQQGGQ